MSIPLTRFPVLVQEKILDLMDFYDLYSFSETSKRSRSLSKRSAKRHEGNMKVALNYKGQRYPLKKCYMTGIGTNEAIVRALMTFRKAEHVDMSMEPTADFKNFDFVTPFPESLDNELLEIHHSRWVSAWHIINVFNKCRDVRLIDRMFPFAESDVIEILKSWTTESSIRTLILTVDLDGSIEDFGAKMAEMKAKPVQEAASSMSMKNQRRRDYVSSAWLLKQNNTGVEVLVTLGSYPYNGTHKDFLMKDEFELVPENR
ncbi:unnamed protein product [Caenorhabditis nigoni]